MGICPTPPSEQSQTFEEMLPTRPEVKGDNPRYQSHHGNLQSAQWEVLFAQIVP